MFGSCFLFSKTKNIKNLFEEWSVFLFFVFSVFSKTTFFITIKRCFHCFFTIQIIDFFFLNYILCFHKGELHPTTTPPPANPLFLLKLLKLIYLHIVTKSSFKKIITSVKIQTGIIFFFNLNELCIWNLFIYL